MRSLFDVVKPRASLPSVAKAVSRRDLLRYGGGLGAGILLSGCGGGDSAAGGGESQSQITIPTPAAPATPTAPALTPPVTTPTQEGVSIGTEFGVCCYDLFYQFMYAGKFEPEKRLQKLSERGIRLVRFSAGPFWARDWKAWNANPEKFLTALDALFDAADHYDMKLVVSVLYNPYGLSDYHGEPYSAWANPNSAARRAMDAHVPTIVRRYAGRKSVFMWEFANEMNSFADLPNGYQFYPTVNVEGGTPAVRTVADNITMVGIQSCYTRFAELVRQYDTKHPIGSGSNIPRKHQIHGLSGSYALDTRDQFQQAMQQTLVGKTEVLSIHCYPDSVKDRFDATGSNINEVLTLARQVADQQSVRLYVGEFGIMKSGNKESDRTQFQAFVDAIKASKVDYATMWNYDWDFQPEWSVTFDNDRSWMLDIIAAANN